MKRALAMSTAHHDKEGLRFHTRRTTMMLLFVVAVHCSIQGESLFPFRFMLPANDSITTTTTLGKNEVAWPRHQANKHHLNRRYARTMMQHVNGPLRTCCIV
jgi:hypothetical protein